MIKRLLGSHVLEALNQSKRIVLFNFLTWCLNTNTRFLEISIDAVKNSGICRKNAFTRHWLTYSLALPTLMRILKDNLLIVFTDSVIQTRFNLNNLGRVSHRKVSIKVLSHIRCSFPVKTVI